ncbi:MAG: MBL fold metallo-hydrolase [Planctomycetaceae bacterium]
MPDSNDPLADLALSSVLQQRIQGFAGSFASWFVYIPARILFDAGEGITSRLRNRVFLPEAVFLTHSHLDHISGLHAFLTAQLGNR